MPSLKHFPAVGAFSHKFSIAPSGETTDRIKKVRGGVKMGRTSSITMPSMVGILGRAARAGCRQKSVMFLPAGLRVAQPCRYCFYSIVQKWVFRPAGATRCPDKREIWHGGADRRSAPPCQISRLSGQCGNTAPKTVKNSNFGQKFVPQGRLVCNILMKF